MDRQCINLESPGGVLLNAGNTYAGNLDLNGAALSDDDLKFSALFYEHIVVPDAFLLSYTPLFNHLLRLLQEKDVVALKTDTAVRFLRDGIIVPVIRRGDSLSYNWNHGEDVGIVPGTELRVSKAHGETVLGYVDDNTKKYAAPPAAMDRTANRLSEYLAQLFTGESNPLLRMSELTRRELTAGRISEWHELDRLVREFSDMVDERSQDRTFRRLDVERFVSRKLSGHLTTPKRYGLYPRLYQDIHDAVSDNPRNTYLLGCQYLLNHVSTVYQAYHAIQLKSVGALFDEHERHLVANGMYQHLIDLPGISRTQGWHGVVPGSLDVSKLSAEDIIGIRQTGEYEVYRELLKSLQQPRGSQTFYEVNHEYVDWLIKKYLPAIMSRFPKAVKIKLAFDVTAGAIGGGLIGGLAATPEGQALADSVWIVRHPVLVGVLGGTGGVLTAQAEGLLRWAQGKRRLRRFRRMNRYLFR